jgi:hypothetical protein
MRAFSRQVGEVFVITNPRRLDGYWLDGVSSLALVWDQVHLFEELPC